MVNEEVPQPMLKKVAVLSLAAGLSTALVFAQSPRRRNTEGTPPDPQTMIERRVNFLAKMLDLTDAQKASATSIFTNAYTASQSVHTSLQTNRQSLSEAVKKNDTAAIESLSEKIGALTGQLTAIESKADAAFYATLTADQQAKYDEMPRMGPGAPGGRMGPGGFGPQGPRGR